MTEAIAATLHSYKSLATRKQLQITLEVPAEYAAQALKMLGVGDPGESQWFALAKLAGRQPAALIGDDEKPAVPPTKRNGPDNAGRSVAVTTGTSGAVTHADKAEGQDKPRTYTRSQRAAMMCQDQNFRTWFFNNQPCDRARKRLGLPLTGDIARDEAVALVTQGMKDLIGIESRRELDTPGPAADAFDRLMTDYSVRGMVR